jgi:hypothetical protein
VLAAAGTTKVSARDPERGVKILSNHRGNGATLSMNSGHTSAYCDMVRWGEVFDSSSESKASGMMGTSRCPTFPWLN